jgi:hypothetical protein
MNERINPIKTNEDRIKELERIRKLQEMQNEDKSETDEYANLERQPLSIDTQIKKRILLSWGGGSDGFDLYFNTDKDLLRGVYWCADWGEYYESELTESEADEVYNFYMGGYFD